MKKPKVRIARYLSVVLFGLAACDDASQGGGDESRTSALTHNTSGSLMTFGGKDGNCVAASGAGLIVSQCQFNDSPETFTLVGSELQTSSGQCVDVQFGNLGAGVIDLTTCNDSVNQQWTIANGEITSANRSDGQQHCLDVHFGSHALGTPIDLATCNGTAAQVFWPNNFTVDIKSAFTLNGGSTCECLDVLFDNEQAGATLDDSECNGTNAQWFVLDFLHHIELANNGHLCLGFSGPVQNGLAPVALETCNYSDPTQAWYFASNNVPGGGVSIVNESSGCLDIFGGNPANATLIDDYTCNGSPAQLWFPQLGEPLCIG